MKKIIFYMPIFLSLLFAENSIYPNKVELTGKLGNERNIGELDFLFPLKEKENSLTFLDVRAQSDNQQSREFNLGLGKRTIFNSQLLGDYIFGRYGFFDVRESKNDNLFYQTTFGLELLSDKFDFRSNAYIPINDEENISNVSYNLNNTTSGLTVQYSDTEKALYGMDIEVGTGFYLQNDINLRLYAGYYYFDNSEVESVNGPRYRAETIFEQDGFDLKFGWINQDDDIRGTQNFAVLSVIYPFGKVKKNSLSRIKKRMLSTVIRDVDIVTNDKKEQEKVLFEDGREVSQAYENVDSKDDLINATNKGKKDSLVIISDDIKTDTSALIREGQMFVGGNQLIKLKTASGKSFVYKTKGKRQPVIKNDFGEVFTISDATNSEKVKFDGFKIGSTKSVVLPSNIRTTISSSSKEGDLLASIKAFNSQNIELTYEIASIEVDGVEKKVADNIVSIDSKGNISLGANALNGGVPSLTNITIKTKFTKDGKKIEYSTAIQVVNKNVLSAGYDAVLPNSVKSSGITFDYSNALNSNDGTLLTVTKKQYVEDIFNKLLEKDKKNGGGIYTAIIENSPHVVSFENEGSKTSDSAIAYLYSVPNSQDLQADEIFPNANKNNGQDSSSGKRDATVEEITHMIQNYGISYARPDLQKKLNEITEKELGNKKLNWTESNELPRADLDDELLAEAVELYYGLRAGVGVISGKAGYTQTYTQEKSREILKDYNQDLYNIVEEIFPNSLNLGY